MDFEQEKLAHKEQKDTEKLEQEKLEEVQRQLEYSHEKERLLAQVEKDKKLIFLKSLIERNLIRPEVAEKIIENEALIIDDLRPIFEQIDAIEAEERIEEILPKSLRITKDEYLTSLEDPEARSALLQRLDQAIRELTLRSRGGDFHPGLGIFRAFLQLLDRNLHASIIRVKQKTLEIRDSLSPQTEK